MYKLLFGLLAFCLSINAPAIEKEWTIYVHMNGDNNLCPYTSVNLKQMRAVDASKNANVVVAFDCNKQNDSKTILLGKKDTILDQNTEYDMGDWQFMANKAIQAFDAYPAKHHMVIIWNHGGGWKLKSLRSNVIKDISWDDGSNNHITTQQIGQAVEMIGQKYHLDLLGYDACLMQMIEVGYEVGSKYVDYFIGSEETEAGDGWDYTPFMRAIATKATPEQVGHAIVNAYATLYASSKDATMSMVNAKALESLAEQWKAYISTTDKKTIYDAMDKSISYAYSDYKDFGTVLTSLEVPDWLKNAYADAVLQSFGNGTGISIEYQASVPSNYFDLKFPNDTGWLK